MAYKTAPKFTYVWTVTYRFGWSPQGQASDDFVAYDIPELLEQWKRHISRNMPEIINPSIVKVERGKSLYA